MVIATCSGSEELQSRHEVNDDDDDDDMVIDTLPSIPDFVLYSASSLLVLERTQRVI